MRSNSSSHQMLSLGLADTILDLECQVESGGCTQEALTALLSAYCVPST